jgi:hypothetical protein
MAAGDPLAKPVGVAAVISDTLPLKEAAFAASRFYFFLGLKYRRNPGQSKLKSHGRGHHCLETQAPNRDRLPDWVLPRAEISAAHQA